MKKLSIIQFFYITWLIMAVLACGNLLFLKKSTPKPESHTLRECFQQECITTLKEGYKSVGFWDGDWVYEITIERKYVPE